MSKYICYEELRDRYVELPDVLLKNKDEARGYDKAISEILELMSSFAAVRTDGGKVIGKWKSQEGRGKSTYSCTACGQATYVPTCMGEPMYAFCPNCGAKMGVNEEWIHRFHRKGERRGK